MSRNRCGSCGWIRGDEHLKAYGLVGRSHRQRTYFVAGEALRYRFLGCSTSAMITATPFQATTYLFGVCLFSISFLVFVNSSLSFVITDLVGDRRGVGNAVGTLGFADELVALVACPLWGILSDRVGVRAVCVVGYSLVGLALFLLVQSRNVYPQLLLARLFFSIGGAAVVTMVTAILPSMTASAPRMDYEDDEPTTPISDHIEAPSISSELTITPARIGSRPTALSERHATSTGAASPTRLAGIVGMFTGCGALVALALFLRLPTIFRRYDTDAGQALADAYYVVGTIAFFVALCCFFGLRKLKGEEGRSWRAIYRCVTVEAGSPQLSKFMSYRILLLDSLRLGLQNDLIGLGYLGAFVARASSVCISLFIPLSVNNYFTSSGKCRTDDLANIKEQCHEAYVLAAQLTGTSQLIGLICAPLFGYLADRYQRFHLPLLVAAICGIAGYGSFAGLKSPESDGQSGSHSVFVIVALLGISQIGCIVCSLGLLGRGILGLEDQSSIRNSLEGNRRFREVGDGTDNENRALLTGQNAEKVFTIQLKGSIAGVYSFAGGIGILFLTKLGGFLFDAKSPASPFYMLAGFNTLLLVVLVLRGMVEALGEKKDA